MADTEINGLTAIAALAVGDLLHVNDVDDSNNSRKATLTQLITLLNATAGLTNGSIDASAAIAYSKLALTDTLLNADVNSAAAIAYSKLDLGTSILNADINGSAAIAYSKLDLGTSIVNADVGAGAAIAYSKLNLANSIDAGDLDATVDMIGTQHIYIPSLSMYPATTAPCADHAKSELATNDVDYYSLDFAGATANEIAKFDWIPPENWDAGTVQIKFYWTGAAGAGTVEFETSGIAIGNDDPLDAAFGTAIAVTDTFIAADDMHVSPQSTAITIGGTPANADWVQFKIVRDQATDTKAEDAKLIGAVLEYTIDAATSSG